MSIDSFTRKKILIICNSKLSRDPRVLKQFNALEGQYVIDTLGKDAIGKERNFFELKYTKNSTLLRLISLGLLIIKLFKVYQRISGRQLTSTEIPKDYDAIISNDLEMLPLSFKIAKEQTKSTIPVWADLHEYAPGQVDNNLIWRLLYKPYKNWICRKYLPKCQRISTVCQTIGERYSTKFNVEVQDIIFNSPDYEELTPSKVNSELIKLVHHGIAIQRRHLETMIDVLDYLPKNYELNLLLVANNEEMRIYKKELLQYANGKDTKVNFIDPVPTKEISRKINQFDIGLFILKPVNFNYTYALPNKFFEFIQGRLCIAVSPNFEMKKIVEKYDLGIVSDDYTAESMAKAIEGIQDVNKHKHKSSSVAKELSSERTYQQIKAIVASMLRDI